MTNIEYQLIENCRKNDENALQQLYARYAPKMLGVCMRYVNDKSQAEDILHDGFITVFEKLHQFKGTGSFEGWMYKIFVNTCLQTIKKREQNVNIDDYQIKQEPLDSEKTPKNAKEAILSCDFTEKELLTVIGELPAGFRMVFNLYVFEKYSHKRIAKTLGISTGTSKSQLMRARKQIQEKLYRLSMTKNRNKEKVYSSLFILTMNKDLTYIDSLLREKLSEFSPTPKVSEVNKITKSPASSKLIKNSYSTLGNKLLTVVYHKAFWATTLLFSAGLLILTAHFTTQNSKQKTINQTLLPLKKMTLKQPVVSVGDSTQLVKLELTQKKRAMPVVKTDTIRVKKVVTIKKKKYIMSQTK